MKVLQGIAGLSLGAALVLCAAGMPANATAEFAPDQIIWLNDQAYGPAGQFHLYDRFHQKEFNFATARKVRLCVDRRGAGIGEGKAEPMTYRADSRSGVVVPGACKTVTAQHIALSPAGAVPENWEVDGSLRKAG